MLDLDQIVASVVGDKSRVSSVPFDLDAAIDRVVGIDSKSPWIVFASGLKRGQFWGFSELGYGVGFSLAECRTDVCLGRNITELVKMANTPYAGASVLVDSGAVAEVDPAICRVKPGRAITPALWDYRMEQYLQLASALGPLAWLIAPDKVCDQRASIERFRRQAGRLRKMAKLGAVIVLPLQPGELSLYDLDRQLVSMLRGVLRRSTALYPGSQVIVAVPMRSAPGGGTITPLPALLAYLRRRRPPAVHLLGMGPRNRRLRSTLIAIEDAVPGIRVSIDAAVVRPQARRGRPWMTLKPDVQAEVEADWRQPLEQLDFTEIAGYMESADLAAVAGRAGAPAAVVRQIERSVYPQEQFSRLWNFDEEDPWFGLVDDRALRLELEQAYVRAVPKFGSDAGVSQRDRRLVHRVFGDRSD